MRFRVKTLNRAGQTGTLVVDAGDALEAQRLVAGQGLTSLSASRVGGWSFSRKQKFPLKLFSQELLALLESGLTVVESIEVLAEKERVSATRLMLEKILSGMREGKPFSSVLETQPDIFPQLYVASIRASEKTSDLDEALRRYIAYQTQVDELRAKLVSASIYPALLVGVGGLIIVFLLAFVVPRFSRIYEDIHGDLPWLSQVMLDWGRFVEQHGLSLLMGLLVCGLVLWRVMTLPATRKAFQDMLWRSPTIGERLRIFHLSRCYRTTSMLLRGGIPLTASLGMVSGFLAPALSARLTLAIRMISEGQPASHALEVHQLTTPVAQRLLRVGERTGNMGEMMERISAFHDEEMVRWIDKVTRLFGPVLMLGIGVMIGLIVVLLYLPIFQVADSIQ